MAENCISQSVLDKIFPPERTDAFFEALYGGAEDGAYDIRLACRKVSDTMVDMLFELHGRPNKCLKCSLTHGLPQVFKRHPILDLPGVAKAVAAELGWPAENISWEVGATQEISDMLHVLPFQIIRN